MKADVGMGAVGWLLEGWLFEGVGKTAGLLKLEEGMVAALLETMEIKTRPIRHLPCCMESRTNITFWLIFLQLLYDVGHQVYQVAWWSSLRCFMVLDIMMQSSTYSFCIINYLRHGRNWMR